MSPEKKSSPRRPDSPPSQDPEGLPTSDQLTRSEIESLRLDKKEAAAYGRKAFKDWRPDRHQK